MKRKIAIVLTALSIALCMVACGSRNDSSTVSESKDGHIQDDRSITQRTDRNRNKNASTKDFNDNTITNNSAGDDLMDDMRNAASDAGETIGDAGRAIDNAMSDQEANGSGMTGTR